MSKDSNTRRRLKNLNSVFHKKANAEDDSNVSATLLKEARRSGILNLSSKNLSSLPQEILTLSSISCEGRDVDFDHSEGNWWEMEPLSLLDLSSNCLSVLPTAINQLDTLTVLMLHNNNLSSVPAELGHLFKLTKLDLARNNLQNLPAELSGLKELRWFNVGMNELISVPDCIYDLVMLQYLDLSNNKLQQMKPGVGFLIRLTSLNLSHNRLSSLPPDISNCKGLISLDLSHNVLTSSGLPPLGDLHSVQMIHLTHNKLTLLPSLNGCSSLKEIHLGYNQMKEVTIEELSTLSHLQVIVLRDNLLERLPKEMSCLQNLTRLDLTNNNLTELPATLGLLPHLRNLLVVGNSLRSIRRDLINGGTTRLLKYLKETMPLSDEDKALASGQPCQSDSKMPDRFSMRSSKTVNLACRDLFYVPDTVFDEAMEIPCSVVDLSKNKLTEIPVRMWCLAQSLTDLNLSHNKLREFPDAVKDCVNLTHLSLETNTLTSLPSGLSNCRRLREINLACNRFTVIPTCLYEILGLEILIVRDNKVTALDAEALIGLKHLATLDLTNNNISSVPAKLGLMTHLRYLGLEGNGLKVPGPALLARGTETVLAWLRDKIPH